MSAKTQLRYALVHTSCKSRIFQMVTMSLCIAFKHFSKLIPKNGSPVPIAVQYSVKCSRDIELDGKLQSPLTLVPYSIIMTDVRFIQLRANYSLN
jgi:hypothetical protein